MANAGKLTDCESACQRVAGRYTIQFGNEPNVARSYLSGGSSFLASCELNVRQPFSFAGPLIHELRVAINLARKQAEHRDLANEGIGQSLKHLGDHRPVNWAGRFRPACSRAARLAMARASLASQWSPTRP